MSITDGEEFNLTVREANEIFDSMSCDDKRKDRAQDPVQDDEEVPDNDEDDSDDEDPEDDDSEDDPEDDDPDDDPDDDSDSDEDDSDDSDDDSYDSDSDDEDFEIPVKNYICVKRSELEKMVDSPSKWFSFRSYEGGFHIVTKPAVIASVLLTSALVASAVVTSTHSTYLEIMLLYSIHKILA